MWPIRHHEQPDTKPFSPAFVGTPYCSSCPSCTSAHSADVVGFVTLQYAPPPPHNSPSSCANGKNIPPSSSVAWAGLSRGVSTPAFLRRFACEERRPIMSARSPTICFFTLWVSLSNPSSFPVGYSSYPTTGKLPPLHTHTHTYLPPPPQLHCRFRS